MKRRALMRWGGVIAGIMLLDCLAARLVLGDGQFLGRPVAPFDPPLFSSSQKQALRRLEEELGKNQPSVKFDGQLGWSNRPCSGFGEFRYDWAGARIAGPELNREKLDGVRRILAFGCSMTHGEEVPALATWCAQVDGLLAGVEVVNLGVAAYGLDQAYLRMQRDGWLLQPDEVWLALLPQAALRITTRFRPLLDHWSLDVAFKPRFVLGDEGRLALLGNPAASLEAVPQLLRDQREFLRVLGEDTWVARAWSAYQPRGSSWTHYSLAARLFLTWKERTGRDVRQCFEVGHPFESLLSAIVKAAASDCASRSVAFRLLILPGPDDLHDYAKEGGGYWEPWVARVGNEGVASIDFAPALAHSGLQDNELFAPQGHYTPRAGEIVARALAAATNR
jgi:hypothetical protein